MTQIGRLLLTKLAVVFGVAISWHLFFMLNAWLMAPYTYARWASWIFMPAALRIIAVLLFNGVGAVGLALGALYTIVQDPVIDLPYQLLLATSSGLAPMLAVWLCRVMFGLGDDLHGLRPLHIAVLSVAGAATNSVLSNLVLALAGRMNEDLRPLIVVFLGDINGTAIVLFITSLALNFAARWR